MSHPDRVIPEREIVGKEVAEIINEFVTDTETDMSAKVTYTVKELTDYCMQQSNNSYYRGQRGGVLEGRKQAKAMLEALIKQPSNYEYFDNKIGRLAYEDAVPVTELQAVITALEGTT